MKLQHYKQVVLDGIRSDTDNPQNWRLQKWVNEPTINVKRLLKDMEREGLIEITFTNDRGKIRRILKPRVKNVVKY